LRIDFRYFLRNSYWVALWLLAGATVWAYYAVPSVAAALEPLLRWQTHVPGDCSHKIPGDCPHKIHTFTTPNGKAIRCVMGSVTVVVRFSQKDKTDSPKYAKRNCPKTQNMI
jgi:hypothetical protein